MVKNKSKQLKQNSLLYVIYILGLFLTYFSINLSVLPLHTVLLIGILGGITFLVKALTGNRIQLSSSLYSYVIVVVVLSLPGLFCYKSEPSYLYQSVAVPIVFYFGYYCLQQLKGAESNCSGKNLARDITIILTIQSVLAILMSLSPVLLSALDSTVSHSDHEEFVLKGVYDHFNRFVGYGTQFFGAAVAYSFGLLFIARLFVLDGKVAYILLFTINSIVGLLLARTTIVGIIAGLVIVVSSLSRRKKIVGFSIIICLSIVILAYSREIMGALAGLLLSSEVTSWAFEPLINLIEEGSLQSGSTNVLESMMTILPTNPTTWLIGDGAFTETIRGRFVGYYMHTDVGYLRIIFATGLIGLIGHLSIVIRRLYTTSKINYGTMFAIAINVVYLMLLVKGFYTGIIYVFLIELLARNDSQQYTR